MSLLAHWPDMLTIQEAAEILRADPALVTGFIQAGWIRYTDITGRTLIPRRYFEEFIEASCVIGHPREGALPSGPGARAPAVEPEGASLEKHLFASYALNWFEVYSKPNIETVDRKSVV